MKTRKERTFKKFMALCMTMVFILTMSLSTFAAGFGKDSTGSITVKNVEAGVTVSAYQVIKVNVNANGQPEEPMYTWVDSVAAWLKNNDTYKSYVGENNSVVKTFVAAADDELPNTSYTAFWEELAAAIKAGTITGLTTKTAIVNTGATSVSFTDMSMGQYLLTANGGVNIYQPSTAGLIPKYDENGKVWKLEDAEVDMKSADPSIEKEVVGEPTVAIGDTVEYMLTVTVPDYPTDAAYVKFEVGDTLSKGLTYNDDVKVYSDEDMKTEILAAGNYNSVTDTTQLNGKTFLLQFTETFIKGHRGGQKIYLSYSATVNENAFTKDALNNKAFLGYKNDPYVADSDKEKTDETEVYTYGIKVTKVDKEDTALSGAEFKLYKAGDESNALKFNAVSGSDGVYKYDSQGKGTTDTLKVATADGTLQLQGLDVGTYVLKETKAPDGYVIPAEGSKITIVIEDKDGATADDGQGPDGVIDKANATATGMEIKDGTLKVDDTQKNLVTFSVVNTSAEDAGFNLPQTGGMGTMLFTVGGILLMGGAVAMIIVISRRRHSN